MSNISLNICNDNAYNNKLTYLLVLHVCIYAET